jgi:predicted nucleic acid-binding protein
MNPRRLSVQEMEGPVVLDTSVIIKWFRQGEILAGPALALRHAYLAGRISITLPSLVAYELANVLRYKADLSTEQVQAAVRSLYDMQLGWMLPAVEMMEQAVAIARSHETTVYDATFAALAGVLEATFVTADERLARKLKFFSYVRFLGELKRKVE